MSQRTTSLYIPEPCAESWDAMTPTGLGRHCAACQKTVVDFTQKSDAEILAALRQATGGTCGRLRPDQLERPLLLPSQVPRWRAWLGATLAIGSVLSGTKATAQLSPGNHTSGPVPAASPAGSSPAPVPPGQPNSVTPVAPSSQAALPGGVIMLRGIVTDSTTQEGLPGVTVLLVGTTTGAATNATGAFALLVAADEPLVQLRISSVGYVSQTVVVPATSSHPLAITMHGDVMGLMSGVVVAGGVSQRPWPWHPRRFFNWSIYWLTRPFHS